MPETKETVVCVLGLVVGMAGIITGIIVLKTRQPDSIPGCRGSCEFSRAGTRGTVQKRRQSSGGGGGG